MFSITHPAANRTHFGAESVHAEPLATLAHMIAPVSGVKRAVLAMSMRFSYDATANRAVIS